MTRLMVLSAAQCLSWTRVNCFAFLRIELVPAFRVFQNVQDVWICASFFHLLVQTLLCEEGNLKFCPNTALKVELTFFPFSRIKLWWFSLFPFLINQIIWKAKTWKERTFSTILRWFLKSTARRRMKMRMLLLTNYCVLSGVGQERSWKGEGGSGLWIWYFCLFLSRPL